MLLLVEMCQNILKARVRDSGVLKQAILTYVLTLTRNAAVEAHDTHNFASRGLSRSMLLKPSMKKDERRVVATCHFVVSRKCPFSHLKSLWEPCHRILSRARQNLHSCRQLMSLIQYMLLALCKHGSHCRHSCKYPPKTYWN